jgi:hypothetical protein
LTLLLGVYAGLFGSLLGCMMLAVVFPGVSIPLAKAPQPTGAVDLRLVPIAPQSLESPEVEQWEFPILAGGGLRTKFHCDLQSFTLGP